MTGHLDSVLRGLADGRALLCDGDGFMVAIVPWTAKRRGGKAQAIRKEFTRADDPGPEGRWIRGSRVEAGMTQAKLAEALGLSSGSVVAHWEAGDETAGKESKKMMTAIFGQGPWDE